MFQFFDKLDSYIPPKFLNYEYELSMVAQIEGPFDTEYMIVIFNLDNHDISHKCHKVLWDRDSSMVSCGRKKFESNGILY
jgi:hypothetical protein